MFTVRLRSFAAAVICIGTTALVAGPFSPAAADVKPACAGAKERVVDVTHTVTNLADFGVAGQVWALTSFDERVQIWRVGTDRFCVRRDAQGTFETFAGASPNLTGTVSAGVTGTFEWTVFTTITGEFLPRVPVSGYIGEIDAGCQQDGTCATTAYRVSFLYFANGVKAVQQGWFSIVYDAGSHGVFTQNVEGDFGDITG